MWNRLRVLLIGLAALTLSACGGSAPPPEDKGPPPFEIKLISVEQWSDMGGKIPDGQYVVVQFNVKNTSNETQNLNPADFQIQNITKNPKDQYSQDVEPGMANPFFQAYGNEKVPYFLENPATVHPRIEVQRYLVYQLPKEAEMESYQLFYKPYELKLPFEGVDTTDHRNPSDVPVGEAEESGN